MNADDIKRLVIETEEEIFSITGDIEAFIYCDRWSVAMSSAPGDQHWEYYPKRSLTKEQQWALMNGLYPGQKPIIFCVHVERTVRMDMKMQSDVKISEDAFKATVTLEILK